MKLRRKKSVVERFPKSTDVAAGVGQSEKVFFDVDDELDEGDWDKWLAEIKSVKARNLGHDFRLTKDLLMLNPERRDELELDDEVYRVSLYNARENMKNHKPDLTHALTFFQLFPEHKAELGLNDDIFRRAMPEPEYLHQSKDFPMRDIHALCILFPERREELASHYDFEILKEPPSYLGDDKYVKYMMRLSLLFPERKHELDIPNIIERGRNAMKSARPFSNTFRSSIAVHLMMLTADEVRVTGSGIQLINHEQLDQYQALPVRNIAA